tara:strand:+ start:39 stop:1298 length:1260 start_codon:yes stop_codon:yes gene_type:complete
MAKVKIQGHASGSGVLTITAPNTSTDRTITLPDATATIATTAATDALTATTNTLTTRVNAGGRKNIIINGDMQVAQRGTSSTATGRKTVDRFLLSAAGQDEAVTQSQHALTSGDTEVWAKGFRNSYHFTNGNQTSGAGAADRVVIHQYIESQDIANSGWNYNSSSSYITLSFWVKSSVAQNFYGRLHSQDGTGQGYAFETGSLTANTWTKITKAIPGHSNLTFDNDINLGLTLEILMFRGTDKTGSMSLDSWDAFVSGTRVPDMTTTWYTTNDATFEITGVQLELGSVATDFEHRSYGEELALCQRYYTTSFNTGVSHADNAHEGVVSAAIAYSAATATITSMAFPVKMRTSPSLTIYGRNAGTGNYAIYKSQTWTATTTANNGTNESFISLYLQPAGGGLTAHYSYQTSGHYDADAEI